MRLQFVLSLLLCCLQATSCTAYYQEDLLKLGKSYQNTKEYQKAFRQKELARLDRLFTNAKEVDAQACEFIGTLLGGGIVAVVSPAAIEILMESSIFLIEGAEALTAIEEGTALAEGAEAIESGAALAESSEALAAVEESQAALNGRSAIKWGKNSNGHLIKHRDVLGYGHKSAQEAQKLLPQLRQSTNKLLNHMKLERVGRWESFENAKFYIGKGKMIVTQKDGTFITAINKTSNNWFQKALQITS